MSGGPAQIGRRAEESSYSPVGEPSPAAAPTFEPADGIDPPSPWPAIVAIALAVLAAVWVAAMLFLARDAIGAMAPIALAQFLGALLIVPVAAGMAWLLTLRTSNAEAQRFGTTARAMRDEAARLEQRIATLAYVIEDNRLQLAEQVQSFVSLGDGATARLSTVGRELADEIGRADTNARALSQAADGAQANLAVLLATMPRAKAETDALGESIDRAGLTASERAAALDAQVVALSERGREAEAVAGGAAQKLAAHIARMEATSETASARLERVTGEMSGAVDALLDRTAQAVDQSRQGLAAQGDAMLAMVGANQAALDAAARESAEALAERVAIVDHVIDRIANRLEAQRTAGDSFVTDLEGGIVRVSGQLDDLHATGTERTQALAQSMTALGDSAAAMTRTLTVGNDTAAAAITTIETLLLALDAASREIDDTLPGALLRLDDRIAASRTNIGAARPELLALVSAAENVHDAIEAIAQVIGDQRRATEQAAAAVNAAMLEGHGRADELGRLIAGSSDQAHRFAEDAAPRLVEALLRVRDTATAAADRARETLASVIPEATQALELAGAEALRRAAGSSVETQVAGIADVAEAAVAAAERASQRLERQVADLSRLLAEIETRVADVREEQEAGAEESFARRASLLIEAMNSAAIDITRTFAPDVADSAWASYLKGDRGVFTRRAVRLLDGAEQRDIHRLYDTDHAFRDQVNRYIHDFEAMLRTILAQRDGSPLGVTLLSSDMGKLYVALAQAIERLR